MRGIGVAVASGLMLFASAAVAQETPSTIFGMYLRCIQGEETRADDVARNVFGPIVQKHVDAGHLTGWVWLAHSQGGAWRRVLALLGPDLDVMMDTREQIVDELTAQHAAAQKELGTVCPDHDDYIWTSVVTSTPDPNALGAATLSTYYACDVSREGRTNQIFEEVLAPLYKKHQDMGHLASWGFYAHRSGGRFRRLETFSGADHKTLLNMQAAIYQEANTNAPLAMNEFRQICNWHDDYMWNNATQP